jgi:hypothetical protein
MDWIGLAQDRDRWRACEYNNEPWGSIKCASRGHVSFSGRTLLHGDISQFKHTMNSHY